MIEPLSKKDIINTGIYDRIEVSRIKEIVNHILEGINEQSFQANLCGDKSTHSVLEDLKNNIEVWFGVLFDEEVSSNGQNRGSKKKARPDAGSNPTTPIKDYLIKEVSEELLKDILSTESPEKRTTSVSEDKDKPSQTTANAIPGVSLPVGVSSLSKINRVELITQKGRQYVTWKAKNVQVSVQDNERTLKVFLEEIEVKK